jgi:uncharacterized protein (DUF952 family)
MSKMIFHIVTPERWEGFSSHDSYVADSLTTEGFIHCSFENQLEGVIGRYYSNASELLILEIDSELLTSTLVEEASTNGEIYPHIYGPINKDSIVNVREWKR